MYTLEYDGQIDLRLFADEQFFGGAVISGEVRDLAHAEGLGLILATSSDTRLIEHSDAELDCVVGLDGLPASERVRVGNFADNPGEELALVDAQGVISVWGRAP